MSLCSCWAGLPDQVPLLNVRDSWDACAVLFLVSFPVESFHQTRGGCRYRSKGTWGNWITRPVILEWLFQMGVLLAVAFFPYPEENYLFCGEIPSFSFLYPNRCMWKGVLLWKWFLPTGMVGHCFNWFPFLSELFPLTFSAWNQDKLVKTAPAVSCLCRANQTKGNHTS